MWGSKSRLILRSVPKAGVSKDGPRRDRSSWPSFETRPTGAPQDEDCSYPTRSRIGSVGRSPCALPVIGARGGFEGPASITKSWSSEYQGPVTFAAGGGTPV